MRTTFTAILILFALIFSHCVVAADFYPITETDKKFLVEAVDAIGKKDIAWIASHTVYPLSVVSSNRTHLVNTKEEFTAILSRELTDSVRAKIVDAAKKPLFKNWQGVMIGDGILWFSEYSRDEHTSWTYGIFAIGDFAFQPKDAFPPH